MRMSVLGILVPLLLLSQANSADEPRLRSCQKLKQAIERYTDKRRAGGSAAQMDSWKRARQQKKNEWDRLKCRHLSGQLK